MVAIGTRQRYITARLPNQSKQEYLYFLTNKLGFDVEICYSFKTADGTKLFSKWKSFLWLLQYEPDEYIKELYMTRDEFIAKASHRSVLDIEIMIDIDEKGFHNSIKAKAEAICKYLKKNYIPYSCYFSGSKSYHISYLIYELRGQNNFYIEQIKREQIGKIVRSDIQKASRRNMIAFEGEPHWKTGVVKKEANLI